MWSPGTGLVRFGDLPGVEPTLLANMDVYNISVPAILETYGKRERPTLYAKSLNLDTPWGFCLLPRRYICPAQLRCALGNQQQKRSPSSRRQAGIWTLEIPT